MRKRRLLLADDSVTIQKVVNLTFADEDIEVIAVGDGDAAMEAFAEAEPDLVLADVNMPGLDGYQICEKIKQNQATKNIPVILLVGSFEPFDEENAKRVGADDFLTKPFQSIRQLIVKVSDLLDAKADNQNIAPENSDARQTINGFDDTLEIEPIAETAFVQDAAEDFGDAGLDDAMIETAQIGSLPVDEAKKFQSAPIDEFSDGQTNDLDLPPLMASENDNDLDKEFGWIEAPSLKQANLLTHPVREDETDAGKNLYEFDGRQEFNDELPLNDMTRIYPHETKITQTFSSTQLTGDLDFEDFDLLDFPQITKTEITPEQDSALELPKAISESEPPIEIVDKKVENSTASPETENLSPAMIEAIADRVVEKLSNKVIKRIVREVLAQTERKK